MPSSQQDPLASLRDEIDQCDSQLLQLLRRRLDLVAEVGKVKHKHGLPIYVPSREAAMLEHRRQDAASLGVSPQLIEDVLRRVMRESYVNEKDAGFKQVNAEAGDVVIIGGQGKLGQLFGQMLRLSGYQVKVLEKDDWQQADTLFANAGLVIVSVPIAMTADLVRDKLQTLPENCILADLTSIKDEPLQAMLTAHKGPVVGLHPMFGPDVASLAKQLVVVCHGRGQEQYQWLLEQIEIWGASIAVIEPTEHDKVMQIVQAMRHFSTFIYGVNLCNNNVNLTQLLALSSPIYRLELAMVGRLFAQDPALYADIIFAQKASIEPIQSYLQQYTQGVDMLHRGDREQFITEFTRVSDWFGHFADQFQQESRLLLQSVNDQRVL